MLTRKDSNRLQYALPPLWHCANVLHTSGDCTGGETHKKLDKPEVMTCSATPSPGMSAANREPPSTETREGVGDGGGAVRLRRGGCSWKGPKRNAGVPLQAFGISFISWCMWEGPRGVKVGAGPARKGGGVYQPGRAAASAR